MLLPSEGAEAYVEQLRRKRGENYQVSWSDIAYAYDDGIAKARRMERERRERKKNRR